MKLLRVGIVGAGQLGQMLALAGYPIGVRCRFLDRSADTPGAQVAPITGRRPGGRGTARRVGGAERCADLRLGEYFRRALKPLQKLTTNPAAARGAGNLARSAWLEKALFAKLKIPVAAHAAIDSKDELDCSDAESSAYPACSRRGAWAMTARGNSSCKDASQIDEAWAAIGGGGLIYEKFQKFSREALASSAQAPPPGTPCSIRLSANTHGGGILRFSIAPYATRGSSVRARDLSEAGHECARATSAC